MAASGKLLENEDHAKEVMPGLFPPPIADIVAGYAWETPLQKPSFFSGYDYTLEKIVFLAKHAGPLDRFRLHATRLIEKELANKATTNALLDRNFIMGDRQGPFIQCLVSGVDQAIRKEDGNVVTVIDDGMSEEFIKIVASLLPHRHQEVLEQARRAAPLEDEKAKEERESINLAALAQIFEAIKQNNEEITQRAIETFREFVRNIKRRSMNAEGYLTNNRYYINLIHLIYGAFDILARRGGELPAINAQDPGRWYGAKADRFCFVIIGEILQLDLSPRLKQILRSGLYYLLNNNKKADRSIDVAGDLFRGVGTNFVVGVSSYYDDIGHWPTGSGRSRRRRALFFFKTYYELLQQHPKSIIQRAPTHSSRRCVIM